MAAKNRLKLDFSLSTNIERRNFLEEYLQGEQFQKFPPTEEELNTMADYLLWGKDPETGKNGKQLGLDLKSKHGTWDKEEVESLDQLLDMPTFNETAISEIGTTQYRVKRAVFSREEALASASPLVKQSFLVLFDQIDRLELQIALYELAHGRRTKEVRPALLAQFTEEEINTLRERTTHWNQYHYLKKRHLLVELRREQYTLRDSYRMTMLSQDSSAYTPEEEFDFDAGIEVLPLGLINTKEYSTAALVFRSMRGLDPSTYSEAELKLISDLYWKKQKFAPAANNVYIDFRELEHVYQILCAEGELDDAALREGESSNISPLLDTLKYYIAEADLTEAQQEILSLKLNKVKNADIADIINAKYGKTYTTNYISTIFRQRIIPRINDAAKYHEQVIGNVFFPENFKKCTGCGELMLRCPENFTRRARANDGFSSRCKKCERLARKGLL